MVFMWASDTTHTNTTNPTPQTHTKGFYLKNMLTLTLHLFVSNSLT